MIHYSISSNIAKPPVQLINWLFSRWKKLFSLLMVILTATFIFVNPASAQTSPCMTHGMRIVGENAVYLSHMPLFNGSCHNYQALLEVTFEGAGDPQAKYLIEQKKDPNQNEFTFEPTQEFSMPDLESGKIQSFKGNIHRGQYERNATRQLIASNVNAKVKRVVYFRRLSPNSQVPKLTEYLLFGNSKEQYLAHLITAPPDFDQILVVKTKLPLSDAQLQKAVRLVLPNRPVPDPQRQTQQALKFNDQPAVLINGVGTRQAVGVGVEYFKETRDLL